MPTEKRQRQKEGQQARKEAALLAARKEQRKKRRIVMAVAVVVLLGFMFIVSALGKDNKKNVASGDKGSTTTSTTAAASTTPTSAKPAVPAAGTEPVTKLGIEDIKVGDGAVVKAGDTIVAHYLGATYKDGKEFQASWDSGSTFETVIGEGKVIQGWDEGIPGMKVGGRRKLTIPAAMAYGATDPGDGSPFGDLVFIVDVYAIK
ncbi:MAG: fkbP, SCI41 [Acidimicrobiales bacterium]|nr:fkbP, SCI41 [Acidimicrobiales bacterium]